MFAEKSFRLDAFLGGFDGFLDCLPRKSEGSRLVGFDRTLLPSSQSCGLDIPLLLKLLHDPRDGFLSPVEYPCNLIGIGGSAIPDPTGSYHFLHEELESARSDFFHSLDYLLQILFVIRKERVSCLKTVRSTRLLQLLAHYYPESDQFHAAHLVRYLRLYLLLLFTRVCCLR